MITEDDVNARLGQWARHVVGGLSGQFLGLPSRCTYLELAIKSTDGSGRDVPEAVWHTDRAVRALGDVSPLLRQAVEMYYLGTGTMVDRAKGMGVSEDTLARRVDKGIQYLITILDDMKKHVHLGNPHG